MKKRRESAVQAGIVQYLCFRPDAVWWRGNVGAAQFGKSLVRFGTKGAADIQGVLAPHGRFFGIEVKREDGGELSAFQEAWGANVVKHGGLYIVARDVQTVIDALGPPSVKVVKVNPVQKTYPRGVGR